MSYEQVLAALAKCRGTGDWQAIADAAGLDYGTVARIARRRIATPSYDTVIRLAAAIKSVGKRRAKTRAKTAPKIVTAPTF